MSSLKAFLTTCEYVPDLVKKYRVFVTGDRTFFAIIAREGNEGEARRNDQQGGRWRCSSVHMLGIRYAKRLGDASASRLLLFWRSKSSCKVEFLFYWRRIVIECAPNAHGLRAFEAVQLAPCGRLLVDLE